MPVIFIWTETLQFLQQVKQKSSTLENSTLRDEIENEMMSVWWSLLKFQPADTKIWAKESALLFEMFFEIGSDGRTLNSLVLCPEFFNLNTRNNT